MSKTIAQSSWGLLWNPPGQGTGWPRLHAAALCALVRQPGRHIFSSADPRGSAHDKWQLKELPATLIHAPALLHQVHHTEIIPMEEDGDHLRKKTFGEEETPATSKYDVYVEEGGDH